MSTSVKNIGCPRDLVCLDSVHLYNYSTKNCLHFNYDSFTHKICMTVANKVLCVIVLFWFPDNNHFVDRNA